MMVGFNQPTNFTQSQAADSASPDDFALDHAGRLPGGKPSIPQQLTRLWGRLSGSDHVTFGLSRYPAN